MDFIVQHEQNRRFCFIYIEKRMRVFSHCLAVWVSLVLRGVVGAAPYREKYKLFGFADDTMFTMLLLTQWSPLHCGEHNRSALVSTKWGKLGVGARFAYASARR